MRGDHLFGRLPLVEPPGGRGGDHADQGLRVESRETGVEAAAFEIAGEDMRDLVDRLVQQAGIGAGGGRGGLIAHQDPETVGALLDIGQQRQGDLFQPDAGAVPGQRRGDHVQQRRHLAVDDDRVEPFLTAEVFVHNGFGDLSALGDLLDGSGVVSALGEQRPSDLDQLLAPLRSGHPRARHPRRITRSHRCSPASLPRLSGNLAGRRYLEISRPGRRSAAYPRSGRARRVTHVLSKSDVALCKFTRPRPGHLADPRPRVGKSARNSRRCGETCEDIARMPCVAVDP